MKTCKNILLSSILLLLAVVTINAQPYSLDEEIKPVKLELKEDRNNPNSKIVITNAYIEDKDQYFFVKGHDLFEFIDVLIFSNYGTPNIKADLVNNNWKDIKSSQTTKKEENGIINFKLRTYGDFGLHIYPTGEKANYTIMVKTSEPVKEYLGSAFHKVSKEDIENNEAIVTNNTSTGDKKNSTSSNTWLYIALGVAGLIIALLVGIVLGRKKTTSIIILLLLSTTAGFAQQHGGNTWHDTDAYGDWLEGESADNDGGLWEDADEVRKGKKRLDDAKKKLGGLLDSYKTINDLYNAYEGLSACINSTPPAGMPSVPTFCETDECANCFISARQRFEENRYTFEKLRTIYSCTKTFSDAAIAFGDNVSGYHGISGMAWQAERIKINKSVTDLKKAYDKKYTELLEDQLNILSELNDCENEHGIPDWFDRFGKLYFDFTRMNYKRND